MTRTDQEQLLERAPKLNAHADLTAAGLTSQEAFLLSQVDGSTPASILADLVAIDERTLIVQLRRLEQLGLIRWAGDDEAAKPGSTAVVPRVTPTPPPGVLESCDLSVDDQQRILEAERTFATMNHWQVLGLAGEVTASDVKRAYFAASKAFHPDRYYGRNLGSFRERLERVFLRVKAAHDALVDDALRTKYRAKVPVPSRATTVPGVHVTPIQPAKVETPEEKRVRLERHRQEILANRRQARVEKHVRPNSAEAVAKNRKADELYQHGLGQLKASQAFAAAASFKIAMTYDPLNAQYRAAFAEATELAQGDRAQQLAQSAAKAEGQGDANAAANDWARAFELSPQRADYAIRAAAAFLVANNVDRALHFSAQAVEVAPNRIEACKVAAEACERAGDKTQALVHWQAAERLDPADSHVKNSLKRFSK